ncbi:predicted protein, partial [Nematostella vectensis]
NTASNCPCRNNGTCLIDESGGHCTCPVGYTGARCETELTTISATCSYTNPCKNGGTCSIVNADYTCACRVGTTGRNCE